MKGFVICKGGEAKLEGVPETVKLLPLGHVKSQKGDFKVDRESFDAIVRQFKDRGVDIVIDYEHQTHKDVQAPAAGWIKELFLSDDSISARVEWTATATRSWPTNYRGLIAIHAALKNTDDIIFKCPDIQFIEAVYKALQVKELGTLPHGCIVATAELVGCHRMVLHGGRGLSSTSPGWLETDSGIYIPTEQELLFGDWTPGR